jgi:hypothetical protein
MLIAGAGIVVAVAVAVLVIYMIMTPDQVEVRYGTIVRDPIDGHVWEDNTQTAWVDASDAGNYKVEYIDKLSPEHEQQLAELQAQEAAEQQAVEESSGMEAIEAAVPSDLMQDLKTLESNIHTMGQDVISGLELANQIAETKSALVSVYNQVAEFPVIPEAQHYKDQTLTALNKYIQACDIALEMIASGDFSRQLEAQALMDEATAIFQSLIPSF